MAWTGFLSIWLFRLVLFLVSTPRQLVSLLPDDAYYYFLVAANIATGAGSTFDGVNLTNGYHPLWMMLSTAMWWLLGGAGAGVEAMAAHTRAMLLLQMVLGLLAVILAWTAAWRACGNGSVVPALVPALAAVPWMIYGMTDGLESGLTLLFLAALFVMLPRLRPMTRPPGGHDFAFGALLSMGFFARLDIALLCVSIAVVAIGVMVAGGFPRGGKSGGRPWAGFLVKTSLWAFPVLSAAAVYFFINSLHFDTVTPISGKLKNTAPEVTWNWQWVRQFPVPFLLGAFVVGCSLIALRRVGDPDLRFLWLAIGGMVLLQGANTVLFMHWAVHSWHFTAWWIPGILGGCLVIFHLVPRAMHTPVVTVLVVLTLVVGMLGQWSFLRGREDRAFQAQSHDAALWTRENIPAGRLVGMSDCGVYGAFRGGAVVNLDGVINNLAYQDALADVGLGRWLDGTNVDYIAHHAIPTGQVEPGYGEYVYSRRSHLHRVSGGSITLREEDELYRSDSFHDGRGEMVFVIWSHQPERRFLPELN